MKRGRLGFSMCQFVRSEPRRTILDSHQTRWPASANSHPAESWRIRERIWDLSLLHWLFFWHATHCVWFVKTCLHLYGVNHHTMQQKKKLCLHIHMHVHTIIHEHVVNTQIPKSILGHGLSHDRSSLMKSACRGNASEPDEMRPWNWNTTWTDSDDNFAYWQRKQAQASPRAWVWEPLCLAYEGVSLTFTDAQGRRA